jgi:hypothetical protein
MADTYRARLKTELASLRTFRVNQREVIASIAKGHQYGDQLDTLRRAEEARLRLRGTEARWQELHHALNLEHRLGPAIRLDVPATKRTVSVPARQRNLDYVRKIIR